MWTTATTVCASVVLYLAQGYQDGRLTANATDMTTVKVAQGWLEGELLELVTGDGRYYSFKGVPYAAPPVAGLRFKAPQPPIQWEGVRKATAHGPVCPQKDANETIPPSEDCLFLNVYTRELNPETPLPVMVFIHGGGFLSGSGNAKDYGPDFLVNHGVILVTLNYRLDALGFLCLDTEDVPGNAGLKDQVAALKWVKENIRNFGGDPDNITIFGESSGGASTAFHVLSPMSKGLFKRAISMSGVPFCDWSQPHYPRRRAFILGQLLGKETDDSKELLEFLQSLPAEKLIGQNPTLFATEVITSNIFKLYHFPAVVEKDFGQERFLAQTPLELLKERKVNEVDLLIGHTNEESLVDSDVLVHTYAAQYNRYPELLVPTKLLIQCTPDTILEAADGIRRYYFGDKAISNETLNEFSRYITESGFLYDVHRFVAKIPKTENTKTFLYVFSSYSERNIYGKIGAKYGMFGAAHMDDLMYLFNSESLRMDIDKNSKEYRLVQLVSAVFTNFAKYGTPTPDVSLGVSWPEYDARNKQYVDIGDELTVKADYKPDEIHFWRSVFEKAGVEF